MSGRAAAMLRGLDELPPAQGVVLVRADLNLPMRDGFVHDRFRLERLLPTLIELRKGGWRVAILSHFGRPGGRIEAGASLFPLCAELTRALGHETRFAKDCVGPEAQAAVRALNPGEVVLLENLRFHPGEEKEDADFARQLAALGDLYINDAFSCSHRAHASITLLPRLLPGFAGRALQNELAALTEALAGAHRPISALIGGAKASTKLGLFENLSCRVDQLFVGGALANTFLAALGHSVGASLIEPDMIPLAHQMLEKSGKEGRAELFVPIDVITAARLEGDVAWAACDVSSIAPDQMALDIGPRTIEQWSRALLQSRSLVWNGPLGAFETPPFDRGTNELARLVSQAGQSRRLDCVAGGGDTIAALRHCGALEKIRYVSTGGGAFLEWLEGKELPGIQALRVEF